MRTLTMLLILLGLGVGLVEAKVPNGSELFIQACKSQGANPQLIKSGFVRFELTIKKPSASEEVIQDAILKRKQSFIDIANSTAPQIKPHLDNIFSNVELSVRNNFSDDKKIRGSVLYRDDHAVGALRKYEVSYFDRMPPKWERQWSVPTLVIRKDYPDTKCDNVLWEPRLNNTAHVMDEPFALDHFQSFGRLYGAPVVALTVLLLEGSDPELFQFSTSGINTFEQQYASQIRTSETEQYDEHASATVLDFVKNDILVQRYWIDASRGYICPLIQFYDEKSGKLIEERISKNYFLHQKTGLWYPAYHEHSLYDGNTGILQEKREYRIDQTSFNLNQTIAVDEFAIDIPESANVIDVRNGLRNSFTADKTGTLSLVPGGLDLEKLVWLRKVGDLPVSHYSAGIGYVRIVFMFAGAVLIFLGLFFKWKKWRKNS